MKTTFAAGRFHTYEGERPAELVELPIDYVNHEPGEEALSYEELRAVLAAYGGYYWTVRVHREYGGELDAYYQIGDDDHIYHYRLTMPEWVLAPEGEYSPNYRDDNPYPAPFQWYLATGRVFVRSYTAREYDLLDYYGNPISAIGPSNPVTIIYDALPLTFTADGDVAVYSRCGAVDNVYADVGAASGTTDDETGNYAGSTDADVRAIPGAAIVASVDDSIDYAN